MKTRPNRGIRELRQVIGGRADDIRESLRAMVGDGTVVEAKVGNTRFEYSLPPTPTD